MSIQHVLRHLLRPFVALMLVTSACATEQDANCALPYIGEHDVVNGDTTYYQVGDWQFYRQDSALVSAASLAGKPQLVDFFFTSCPTICPQVTRNMLRAYERFKDTDLQLLSFTVDPKRDSVGHLARYSENLEVKGTEDWWFLTGDKFELYATANQYLSVAVEDADAPGGVTHSGRIMFVDEQGHVRSYADGTDDEDVARLLDEVACHMGQTTARSQDLKR